MRILLADDQTRVRFALRVLLERQPGLAVVGEATNSRDLLDQINATRPDTVLLDWELPGLAPVQGAGPRSLIAAQSLSRPDRHRPQRPI